MEKSTSSPQSPADFLSAVREKSQQLEEEMTNHRELPAGGGAKHHHQLGPKQGMHDTKTHDASPNQNPSSHLIFPAKEKGRKRKEQLIWSMTSFPFLFPVIPNATLLYFVVLSPDFCVVASSPEEGSPDGEANHLGESAGPHGDY